MAEALRVSDRDGLARYVALQPEFNLVSRAEYEGDLQALCVAEGIACMPYSALASGFLTGKYRPGGPDVESPRADSAARYLDGGSGALAALDDVAAAHSTTISAVALAWLLAQPGVTADPQRPLARASCQELLPMAGLELARGGVRAASARRDRRRPPRR